MNKKLTLKNVFFKEYGIGDPQGAATFQGTGNFGIGNNRQLATSINPATKRIEDMEQAEWNQNAQDLNWSLGKGDSISGPIGPNEPTQGNYNRAQPNSSAQMVKVSNDPYGGRVEEEEELEEQFAGAREPSDGRYRDLPGWPRMNTLVEPDEHIPSDNEAEMEDYNNSQEEDYEEFLSGVGVPIEEAYISYRPEDHFRGDMSNIGRADNSKFLVAPENHFNPPANTNTPQNMGGKGAVISPKQFVPEDDENAPGSVDRWTWEGFEEEQMTIEGLVHQMVEEALLETLGSPTPAFTGIHDPSGKGEPKGGSKAFIKNRREVIKDLEKDDLSSKLKKKEKI